MHARTSLVLVASMLSASGIATSSPLEARAPHESRGEPEEAPPVAAVHALGYGLYVVGPPSEATFELWTESNGCVDLQRKGKVGCGTGEADTKRSALP